MSVLLGVCERDLRAFMGGEFGPFPRRLGRSPGRVQAPQLRIENRETENGYVVFQSILFQQLDIILEYLYIENRKSCTHLVCLRQSSVDMM